MLGDMASRCLVTLSLQLGSGRGLPFITVDYIIHFHKQGNTKADLGNGAGM